MAVDREQWKYVREAVDTYLRELDEIYSLHLPGKHDQEDHNPHAGGVGQISEAEINSSAKKLADRAAKAEPQVSEDLKDVVEATGGKLQGYEFRLKTEASIKRKISSKLEEDPGKTLEEAESEIRDTLRYTATFPEDRYTEGFDSLVESFKEKGYEPTEVRSYWTEGPAMYKGVNMNWETPDGLTFELQFHTDESYQTKEFESHEIYEKFRTTDDESERAYYASQMEALWDKVQIAPEAIQQIDQIASMAIGGG